LPNVGKSTLMNALIGERLSIVTPKAQTTRHRILGIVDGDNYQVVFSDTPGILKPTYKLHESMLKVINEALEDADIILYLTEGENIENNSVVDKLKNINMPLIIAINKIDKLTKEQISLIEKKIKLLFPQSDIFQISALNNLNLLPLMERIIELLPYGEPYFERGQLTDRYERFFVAEIFREKILNNYKQEIPYSVEVVVERFQEKDTITEIDIVIYVCRDSQKGIIIGKNGEAIKKTAMEARIDIEKFLNKKVFLQTFVKVAKDWRDNPKYLSKFGY